MLDREVKSCLSKIFHNDEKNLVEQVKSQDKIIKFLKQRLSEAESRMDEFNKMKDVQASSLALIFFLTTLCRGRDSNPGQ